MALSAADRARSPLQVLTATPAACGPGEVLPLLGAAAAGSPSGRGASASWPAVIIVGALGFLIERGLANAIDYYLTANQAVAQRAQLGQGFPDPGHRAAGGPPGRHDAAICHHFPQC